MGAQGTVPLPQSVPRALGQGAAPRSPHWSGGTVLTRGPSPAQPGPSPEARPANPQRTHAACRLFLAPFLLETNRTRRPWHQRPQPQTDKHPNAPRRSHSNSKRVSLATTPSNPPSVHLLNNSRYKNTPVLPALPAPPVPFPDGRTPPPLTAGEPPLSFGSRAGLGCALRGYCRPQPVEGTLAWGRGQGWGQKSPFFPAVPLAPAGGPPGGSQPRPCREGQPWV